MTGERFREIRLAHRKSMAEMAGLLGYKSRQTIYRKETGSRPIVQRDINQLYEWGWIEKWEYEVVG